MKRRAGFGVYVIHMKKLMLALAATVAVGFSVIAAEAWGTDYAAAGLVLCESLAKRVEALAREDSDHHADDSSDQDAEAREAAAAEAARRFSKPA